MTVMSPIYDCCNALSTASLRVLEQLWQGMITSIEGRKEGEEDLGRLQGEAS